MAVPDVNDTIADEFLSLIQLTLAIDDVVVVEALADATKTLDAVPTATDVIEPLPRLIFSAITVLLATALETALPRLIFSPEQVDDTEVADTMVCKSASS